jgi:hypothetical protein
MKSRAIIKKYPKAKVSGRFFKKPSDAAKYLFGNLPKWKLTRVTETLIAGKFVELAFVIFDHADPSNDQVVAKLLIKKGSPEADAVFNIGTKTDCSKKLTHELVTRKFRLAVPAAGST